MSEDILEKPNYITIFGFDYRLLIASGINSLVDDDN